MIETITLIIVDRMRPRPDETHITAQDVYKLRQLINAQLPKPAARTRNTRVVSDFETRPVSLVGLPQCFFVRIGPINHGPQLVTPKFYAFPPHPRSGIEYRPTGIAANPESR